MRQTHAERSALHVERCEILPMSADSALLRVAGRWADTPPAHVELLVGRDLLAPPLPPGPALTAAGEWTAGFEVPAVVNADLALVTAHGATPLPRPARAAGAPGDARADLEDARGTVMQLEARCEVTERELAALRAKVVDAWAEAGRARELMNGREADYEGAQRRAAQAVAIVDELRERAERSEADRDRAQAQIANARSVARDAMDVATRAARELLAERAKTAEAADAADRHSERLARSERELREAREELARVASRVDELEAELAIAQEQIAEAANVAERLAEAEAALDAAQTETAALRERLGAVEGGEAERSAALEHELTSERERLADREAALVAATAEVATLRIELAQIRGRFANSVTRADALEADLEAARDEPAADAAPEQGRAFPFGRSKVSARTHDEAVEALERESAERERAETEAAQMSDRVRELETEIAKYHSDPAPAAVEEDLRHLLAARQRELDEARMELKEQRARYAAVASKMSPTELAATAEARPASDDWTALDDDLLNRLARAKQLSQPD